MKCFFVVGVGVLGLVLTHHGAEHAQDLAALVVDNSLLLLIVQDGDGEAALKVFFGLEVDVAKVCEALVERVWNDVLTFVVVVLGRREAPSYRSDQPSGPRPVPNSFPWGHLSTAGKGKAGYDAPFSPRCQCTDETLTKSSRALSFLAMVTRCA